MSAAVHSPGPDDLPETIPVFPLPGALLLPHGHLPLNIFEPRYLNLTADALGQGRMMGMVQPVHAEPDPVSDTAELYRTGCLGRITSFAETDDGRFLITLTGVSRFRIAGELESVRGYRRVSARYDAFAHDLQEDADATADRQRLLDAVRAYFQLQGIDTDWAAIKEAPDGALVTSLAMTCPFEPREKQALLECPGLIERGEFLTTLMEMAVHESKAVAGSAGH
ncbi:MAG: LON peptidase substrate-binding domain-containing protein [Alphaproteobacteria bacterium]|nr:LON peptidase substrate-binding domain-containing protein [Alphaproteobacteria bacterium]